VVSTASKTRENRIIGSSSRTERTMYLAKQFGRDCVDVSPTPPSRVERDLEQWQPLVKWLDDA
jgi:hypothetical protein